MQLAASDGAADSEPELRVILDAIRHIVQEMRTFSASTESALGLTAAQLFALQIVARHAPLSVSQLAAQTFTHQSSVSVVVRRLVEKGLVKKSPSEHDGRQLDLSPTKAGTALLRRAPSAAQEQLIGALQSLSSPDRQMLASLLGKVVGQLGSSGEAAPMFFEGGTDPKSES